MCGDTIRAVEYASYTVNYCPTCQTGGKVLADNVDFEVLEVAVHVTVHDVRRHAR